MHPAPRPESLRIAGPQGALEALVEEPSRGVAASGGGSAFGVVCHPHPLHGGTLANKVVTTLARALHELGVPTLRFNFRGVGASEGRFAGGTGEAQDALAAVEWGKARWPGAEPFLLGFSFGAIVALGTARAAGARLLVTVAPPVARAAGAPPIERSPGIEQMARESAVPRAPWLIVQGDADEIVDAARVLAWAATHDPQPTVRVLAGAGHFFHGRLVELRETIVAFVREARLGGGGL
ncbi:MAG TPA: alpha/beta hydrolase [Steroidobacteraceae bacterium]|nr:alpha/beta hydrolase [Steroidobacteraceae bacterium]